MNSEEQFSVIVSEGLDVLGYNKDTVEVRRKLYDEYGKIFTEMMRNNNGMYYGYCTISGSKREGLAGTYQSDTDVMRTLTHVQCSDDPASVSRDVGYIFELDRESCPHGYTKLRLFYKNVNKLDEFIENSMIEYPDGRWYLSSTLFISEIESAPRHHQSPSSVISSTCYEPRSGPSLPTTGHYTVLGIPFAQDRVYAFPCQCSDYLQSWINRPRDCDWPSREQIETVATVDAHVVPVGAKGSEDAHLQWRICYTLTEINLMQSLNETKWKLYVNLKMIRDLVFKPLGDLLTSYVLKNVIMWISEFDPIGAFQPKYILQKLYQCLDFLILGFLSKRIPNYMISKRNLLEGRLDDRNTREHLAALNHVRRNLPATILRCTQLKNAMVQVYVAPGKARAEMRQNRRVEMAGLNLLPIVLYYTNELMSCSTLNDLYDSVIQILSHQPEVLAAAMDVPVTTAVYIIQLIKMLPPDIRLNLIHQVGSQKRSLWSNQ